MWVWLYFTSSRASLIVVLFELSSCVRGVCLKIYLETMRSQHLSHAVCLIGDPTETSRRGMLKGQGVCTPRRLSDKVTRLTMLIPCQSRKLRIDTRYFGSELWTGVFWKSGRTSGQIYLHFSTASKYKPARGNYAIPSSFPFNRKFRYLI